MATRVSETELLWTNRLESDPACMRQGTGVVAAVSMASPTHTTFNEDSLAVIDLEAGGLLLLVADGCGGMPAGDRASRAAIEAMAAHVRSAPGDDLTSAVLNGFDKANAAVTDLRLGSGSTLTAVLIEKDRARAFWAGDSPAIVLGQRGAIRFATLPHSLTGFGVEAGLLSEAQAANHADSGMVLNVLGFPEMFVQVGPPISLQPMDTLVLASDALTDNLTVDRVSELCRVGSAEDALEALATETHRVMTESPDGHPDDLSILLYRPTSRRGE